MEAGVKRGKKRAQNFKIGIWFKSLVVKVPRVLLTTLMSSKVKPIK